MPLLRLADVGVFPRGLAVEQVFTRPHLVAVEVLSPEVRQPKVQESIEDDLAFRISKIWIIDPAMRIGCDASDRGWIRNGRFAVPGAPIHIDLRDRFDALDEAEQE